MNIVLDIILVAVIAASVIIGVKKGFMKTVIALAGMLIVFLLAYTLSVPLGKVIDDGFMNSSFRKVASSRIADKIGVDLRDGDKVAQLEGFEEDIENYSESDKDFSVLGIDGDMIKQAAQNASGSLVQGAFSLVDKLSASVSRIIAAILIIVAGVLLIFLLKLLIKPLLKAVRLGTFDSTLGGVLGAVRGVLIVLLIAFVLRLALPAVSGVVDRTDIDKTLVFKYCYHLVDGE